MSKLFNRYNFMNDKSFAFMLYAIFSFISYPIAYLIVLYLFIFNTKCSNNRLNDDFLTIYNIDTISVIEKDLKFIGFYNQSIQEYHTFIKSFNDSSYANIQYYSNMHDKFMAPFKAFKAYNDKKFYLMNKLYYDELVKAIINKIHDDHDDVIFLFTPHNPYKDVIDIKVAYIHSKDLKNIKDITDEFINIDNEYLSSLSNNDDYIDYYIKYDNHPISNLEMHILKKDYRFIKN